MSSIQHLTQQPPGPEQMGLAGSHRGARHPGDFLVPQPFDIVQDEHGPATLGQGRNGPLQIDRRLRFGFLRRDIRRFGPVLDPLLPPPGGSQGHQHFVHRQPVEPGPEGALAPEASQPLPHPDEDVLGQLLGPARFPRQPEADGVDPPRVGLVELPERPSVARPGRVDPGSLGRHRSDWVLHRDGSGHGCQ